MKTDYINIHHVETNFIIFTDDSEIIILYKTKQVFMSCIWKIQKATLILIVNTRKNVVKFTFLQKNYVRHIWNMVQ